MNRCFYLSRLHLPLHGFTIVLMFALTWSSLAFCGEEFIKAVWAGNLERVEALLKKNPDLIADRTLHGWKPLHIAVQQGNKELMEVLLANHANLGAVDDLWGATALHLAAGQGKKGMAELLLAHRADANVKDKFMGRSPLHYAVAGGYKELVKLLLANKADINAKDKDGATPLHYPDVLIYQIDPRSYRDEYDIKPLIPSTAKQGVAEFLLANGADVNAKDNDGRTPLHRMAETGGKELMELLLARGASVNAKDKFGATPLHYAVRGGHKDVAELLSQHSGHE